MKAARIATAGPAEEPTTPSLAVVVPALLLVLAVAGLGVSSYLSYTHWAHASIACGSLGNCNLVNNSDYATVVGIPVALLGALNYLTLIALAVVWLWWRPSGFAWPVMAFWGLTLFGTLYSGYLTYVELFVLDAVCVYCVTSAGIILASFLISTGWIMREAWTPEET